MKRKVIIERSNDGIYNAYFELSENLSFNLFSQGKTVKEAIEKLMKSKDGMKAYYTEENKPYPEELEFEYKFDVPSFLSYYSKILSLSGLQRLTGVNQGQLSHYLTGHRKPSPKTAKKIEKSLHDFANEISQVHFI